MAIQRDMSEETRIQVARSDIAVPKELFHAASQIFSGYAAAGLVKPETESALLDKAVAQALDLAIRAERAVTAKEDTGKGIRWR
jgi:BarA-like signal transduction histidine kinase